MKYEEQINELENIIEKLESGDVGFEDSLKLFEKGSEICKNLSKSFEEAKGKITIIREDLMGILTEEPMQSE